MDSLPPELNDLIRELPPILFRNHPRFKELTGLSPRTLANMDCKGEGPSEKIQISRVVGYPRGAFVAWLAARYKKGEIRSGAL